MTREEALKIVRNIYQTDKEKEALGVLIPELAESEDERIRKELVAFFKEMRDTWHEIYWHDLQVEGILAWLEKQKEQEPKHLELKAGHWYICHRAFCCRADHLTVKEGERFQCEKDGIVKGFVIKEPEKYFKECSAPAPMEDEQIEPHYTKRNALFDKCVENCDPKVMKEVSDEVDEMLEKEQKPIKWNELTWKDIVELEGIINNVHYDFSAGIGQESFGKEVLERFRSTKGIEYLDEAEQKYWREEKQKPVECADDVVEEAEEYTSKVACGEYGVEVTEAYIAGVLSERNRDPKWSEEDEDMRYKATAILNRLCASKKEFVWQPETLARIFYWLKSLPERFSLQPKQEWNDEDENALKYLHKLIEFGYSKNFVGAQTVADMKRWVNKSLRPQPKQEWSEEDEKMINYIDCILDENEESTKDSDGMTNTMRQQCLNDISEARKWLKSLRPSWKPSEEQMKALQNAVALTACDKELARLYNQLKKL